MATTTDHLYKILFEINEAILHTDEHHAEYAHLCDAKREIIAAAQHLYNFEAGKRRRQELGLEV